MTLNQPQSLFEILSDIWSCLDGRRRVQFFVILTLMILAALSEVISIGAVLPFLAVLTEPNQFFVNQKAQTFIHFFKITSADQLPLYLTFFFGVAVVLASAMRLLMLWASTKYSFAVGADIGEGIYRRTLYQPYKVHITRNSSEIIDGISNKANGVIYHAIVPILTLLSSAVMLIFILVAILCIEPLIALSLFMGFGLVYYCAIQGTQKKLLSNSQLIARESTNAIKSLQEGLGGIRDVLLDQTQELYCQIYRNTDRPLRSAQSDNLLINQSPRYFMEGFGTLLIAILAYFLTKDGRGN